jgi:HSP20 family molecular chaperone IbpA
MTRNKDSDYVNNTNNNHYNKFERKISRLFDDFLNDVGFSRTHSTKYRGDDGRNITWSPAIDIKEVEREYLVVADVPGVRKEDMDIEFHDSVLILSGHLNQDLYSTSQAQEINIGKDNQSRQHPPQQPLQYPQPQQYQQQPPQPQVYQQSTEPQQPLQPQPYQQSTEPQKYQQQPSEAQKYQQTVDQKYNLTNEPQQSNNLHQNQQITNDPHHYQQQSNDPNYHQQQSNDPQQYQHVKHRNRRDSYQGERFHIQERPYGHFSRSIQLPSNIKSDDEFYASLENGVLIIRIPKNNDKPRRKITIK